MSRNVGNTDRIVRIILGIVIIVAAAYLQVWPLALVAIIPIGTALVGFCPLYRLFGLSTCPVKA
ncbi:MAG: DUF2892 domain-containing protein [Anaerolineae bacterium]|nr:DUF2892 domain-containing protein [Anaerolineae bacterium]